MKKIGSMMVFFGCVPVDRDTAELEERSGFTCPVWASISPVDSVRTFETTSGYESNTGLSSRFVSTVVSVTDFPTGIEMFLAVDGNSESSSWESYRYQTQSVYRCDDAGAWLVRSDTSSTMVVDGITVESVVSTEYRDTFLMPGNLAIGDAWQSVFSGTTVDNAGVSNDFSYVIESEVTASDTVDVGAGSFAALVIEESFQDGSQAEYRVAPGPGFLSSEDYELVAYSSP